MTTSSPSSRALARCFSAWLVFLDIALVAALLLVPAVWLFGCVKMSPFHLVHLTIHWGWKPAIVPLVLLVIRILSARAMTPAGLAGPRGLFAQLWYKRMMLALVSTTFYVALAEGVLTCCDFKATLPPVLLLDKDQHGDLSSEDAVIDGDPELIYRLRPGTEFRGGHVNNLGFLGRDIDPVKPAGTIRVICMGDSVTSQGRPGYAQYLHERLTNQPPTSASWEAFNMGLFGYSSLQGLMLYRKQVRALHPDIVTLYYGWNDHWLDDRSDRQQIGLTMGPWGAKIYEAWKTKRTFMFLVWMLDPVLHMARLGESPGKLDYKGKADVFEGRVLRVPPEEYRHNLLTLIGEIRADGAIPLLITAARKSLTEEVVDLRYTRSIEEGNKLHDRYVQITREVAAKTHTQLLDLAAVFSGPDGQALFARDGIHFDHYTDESRMERDYTSEEQPGLVRVADEVDAALRDLVRRPEWLARSGMP